MIKFFWQDAPGVSADIERHRAEERRLEERIAELEQQDDDMSQACLRAYRHFLHQLQQSKAEAVNKLGRKNEHRKK